MFNRSFLGLWLLLLALPALACQGLQRLNDDRRDDEARNLIAFIGVDHNLYIIDPATEVITPVTDDAHSTDSDNDSVLRYQHPTWSPDGRRLAFVGLEQVGRATMGRLLVANADGSGRTTLYSSDDAFPFYLYWSPDSQQLGFLAPHGGQGNLALQLVTADGGESRVLDTGQPYYWHWGPDGHNLINHVGGTGGRLAFLELNSDVTETPLSLMPTAFQAPDWSPDGEYILLATTEDDGDNALVLARPDGTLDRTLATVDNAVAFGWSPDGEKIAYITGLAPDRGAIGTLSIIDLADPTQSRFHDEDLVLAFFWSPDSQKIAYFVLTDVPFGLERQVNYRSSAQTNRIYLALRILDLATGEVRAPVSFEPTDAFLNVLPFFDQYQHSVQLWSPDSSEILVSARIDDVPVLWLVSADGDAPPVVLTDGRIAFWSWR